MSQNGLFAGRPMNKHLEDIRQMKAEGCYDEACCLLDQLIESCENQSAASGTYVLPVLYEQLAIIHRKNRAYDLEVRTLERFAEQTYPTGAASNRLLERLEKARLLNANTSNKGLSTPPDTPEDAVLDFTTAPAALLEVQYLLEEGWPEPRNARIAPYEGRPFGCLAILLASLGLIALLLVV